MKLLISVLLLIYVRGVYVAVGYNGQIVTFRDTINLES